ncbi:MAG: hypothetical protein F7C36_07610 [Desulfurococcales archaeon]|nr:hypothetical protein [Desulfurococcales archaeon]
MNYPRVQDPKEGNEETRAYGAQQHKNSSTTPEKYTRPMKKVKSGDRSLEMIEARTTEASHK